MSKIIPFTKLAKIRKDQKFLSHISVVIDEEKVPSGFLFGRDAFISFLEKIDSEFEDNVSDQKKAFNNPAGRLIDLIEEHLSVKEEFIQTIKKIAQDEQFISLEEISKFLHV